MFFIEKYAIPFLAVCAVVLTSLGYIGTLSHLVTDDQALQPLTPYLLMGGIGCAIGTALVKGLLIDFVDNAPFCD